MTEYRTCARKQRSRPSKTKKRLCGKFEKLREATNVHVKPSCAIEDLSNTNLRPQWIVNLSKRKLSHNEESVLSKGPRYAITPQVNAIDFVAPIEAALQTVQQTCQPNKLKDIERTRIQICEVIRRVKKPVSNLTAPEHEALKSLRNDNNIKILHADKGNTTVILDSKDYSAKAHELLGNRTSYAMLEKDLTRPTERSLLNLLRKLKKEKKISNAFYDHVKPSEDSSKPGLFYRKAKLHKKDVPSDRLSLHAAPPLTTWPRIYPTYCDRSLKHPNTSCETPRISWRGWQTSN